MVVDDVDTHQPLTPEQRRWLTGRKSMVELADFDGNTVIYIGDTLSEDIIRKAESLMAGDQLYAQMMLNEFRQASEPQKTCVAFTSEYEEEEEEETVFRSST